MQNDSFRPSVRSRVKDAAFIFILVLTVMLFFSLLTYEPTDSNYWDNAPDKVRNAIGPFGARVSEILFSYFGVCAFFVPFLLIGLGYFMFLKGGSRKWYEIDYDLLSIKIIGLNLLLLSSCTLVAACIYSGSFNSKGGGHLGAVVLAYLRDHLGYNGSVLMMLALFVVGLTLFSGLSLLTICSYVGSAIFWFVEKISSFFAKRKNPGYQDETPVASTVAPKVMESPVSVTPQAVPQTQAMPQQAMAVANSAEKPAPVAPVQAPAAASAQPAQATVAPAAQAFQPQTVASAPAAAAPAPQKPVAQSQPWGGAQTPAPAPSAVQPVELAPSPAPAPAPKYAEAADLSANYISANNPAPSAIAMPSATTVTPLASAARAAESPVQAAKDESSQTAEKASQPVYASTMVITNSTPRAGTDDDASLSIPGLGSASGDEAPVKAESKSSFVEEEIEPTINMDAVDEIADVDDSESPYMSAAFGSRSSSSAAKSDFDQESSSPKFQSTNVLPSPKRNSEMTIKVNPEAIVPAQAPAPAENTTVSAPAEPAAPVASAASAAPSVTTAATMSGFVKVNEATGIEPVRPAYYTPNAFVPETAAPEAAPSMSVIEGGRGEASSNVIDFADIQQASEKPESLGTLPGGFTQVAEGIERSIHGTDQGMANTTYVAGMSAQPASGMPVSASPSASSTSSNTTGPSTNVLPPAGTPATTGTGMRYVDFTADLPDSLNYHHGHYEHDGSELPVFPSLDIFVPPVAQAKVSTEELESMCNNIDECMKHFGIKAHVACDDYGHRLYECGPVITRYMLELDSGKSNKIVNMASDIARTLCVAKVRVIDVIPGVPYVGIEIPNKIRQNINVRELLAGEEFINTKARLPICLGRDITGQPVIYDLASAPHLMVAGTTGSGKSVGINTMLVSLLMKNTPKELRLILIDPKMLEFKPYHDIPHLLTPVITDMKESVSALRWSVQEMERRYKLLSHFQVRNIDGFNEVIRKAKENNTVFKDPLWHPNDSMDMEAPGLDVMPYIVFVIDEFADLILGMKKESGDIEGMISRLAAKARACGIHLILATQSPRAEVIRGSIRANFPSQIAFKVKSAMESRIIIDECGAENLLGRGDMLIKFNDGTGATRRAHGGYLSDDEISRFTDAWRMRGRPNYVEEVTKVELTEETAIPGEYVPNNSSSDTLYDDVVEFVRSLKFKNRQFSVSLVQQHFNIGYNRASRIAQLLQDNGIVSEPMGASKTRSILLDD